MKGFIGRYSWLLGWALFAATVVVVAANWTDEREMLHLAERARPIWLVVAIGLQLATYASGAGIWRLTLERLGVRVPFRDLVALSFAKLFTDNVLPTGGVAGSAVVARALNRRGVPGPKSTAVILVNVLGTYPALGGGLALASLILYEAGRLDRVIVTIAGAFAGVALVVPALLLHFSGPSRGSVKRLLEKVPVVRRLLASLSQVPPGDLRDPVALGSASVLELSILVLDATTLFALMRAVGVSLPWLWVAAAYVVGTVAGVVSFLPGGFGSFDAVNIAILASFGVAIEPALAATMLYRGVAQLLPMLPGWLIARREIR